MSTITQTVVMVDRVAVVLLIRAVVVRLCQVKVTTEATAVQAGVLRVAVAARVPPEKVNLVATTVVLVVPVARG